MKMILGLFLVISHSAYAANKIEKPISFLENLPGKVDSEHGQTSVLAGKNLQNGKDCLLKVRSQFVDLSEYKGESYYLYNFKLQSADSNNYTAKVESNITKSTDFESIKSNSIQTITSSYVPKELAERDITNMKVEGNVLKVSMKHVKTSDGSHRSQNVTCQFDLDENQVLDSSCEDSKVIEDIAVCSLNKNIGKAEMKLLAGEVKLQSVSSKTCYPGKVVTTKDGVITKGLSYQYSNFSFTDSELFDVYGATERNIDDVISGTDLGKNGNRVKKTFEYDSHSKKSVMKYTYLPDFSPIRTTYYNAEFNCQ